MVFDAVVLFVGLTIIYYCIAIMSHGGLFGCGPLPNWLCVYCLWDKIKGEHENRRHGKKAFKKNRPRA